MVAPRIRVVPCRLGHGLVEEYAGGCVVDIMEEIEHDRKFGGECSCSPGECRAITDGADPPA